MTDPYARPADEAAADATIPLVPEAGYAATEEFPFTEETLVTPTGAAPVSPWASGSSLDDIEPGYDSPSTGYADTSPAGPTATNYAQPEIGHRQTNYARTNYPQPQVAPVRTNYPQPQVNYAQAAPSPGYEQRAAQAAFAEPSGPADGVPAQNIYQGYPSAGYGQPGPAWPAVIRDPVRYDYGYSQQPAASDHPNAVISLILGILGLVFFQLLSPVAWYLAAKGRREMAAQPGRWRPSGSLTAGLVLGIIGTVLLGFVTMAVIFVVFAMLSF